MLLRALRPLLAALVLALVGLAPRSAEAASPYAYYAEKQRGETLIIKHTPAPGIVVRNVRVKGKGYHHRQVARHRIVRRHVVRRHHAHRHHLRRVVRNVRDPAIAGFCRDGGAWLKRDPLGQPRVIQKEVCDSVAWYSQAPNDIVIRPDKTRLIP